MRSPLGFLRRSFGRRLAVTLALAGVGGALLTALLVNAAFQSRFDTFVAQQRTAREDQLLAVVTASYVDAGGWDALALAALAPATIMSGAQITVYDDAQQQVWSSADSPMGVAMSQQRHQEMMGLGPSGAVRSLDVTVAGDQVGTMTVAVPADDVPAGEQDFLDSVNRLLLAGLAAAAVVAVAAGALLARQATRPVTELTAAATGLAGGDRSSRARVGRPDEFGQLAVAFNTMADAVERGDQVRRTFAADVAHELRTPLAILRGRLEAVQDGLSEPTPEVIASLQEETLRLGRLVGDLETMTSADAAAFHLQVQPVALADLVGDVTTGARDRFDRAGLSLNTDLRPVVVSGDPDRLGQVVANLCTNAAKFVPAGGRVTVDLDIAEDTAGGTVEGMARLRVGDDGPGIDAADLPYVFDRFYRGRALHVGGSGVGLAVVDELVRAHGGRVTAGVGPLGGALFTVWLPLAVPDPQIAPKPRRAFTKPSQPVPTVAGRQVPPIS